MRKLCTFKGFSIRFILFFIVFISSCSKKVQKQTDIYFNDFEQADLTGIKNGMLMEYGNSTVLGNYHNEGFSLELANLPIHDVLILTFDLYIHDSWDGNKIGEDGVDGPDVWKMLVDKKTYIHSTFSNTPCYSQYYCLPQSYPDNYPNNNHPAFTGAYLKGLPGLCHPESTTTHYKISKTIAHQGSKLRLECLDHLIQENAENPKCDESWSIDNLKIEAVALN